MRPLSFVVLFACLTASVVAQQSSSSHPHFSPAAQRFQNKLDFIEKNAHSQPVQPKSTQINADEVNAWFAEGGYKLPVGVQKVIFHSQADTILANATVDFDAIKEGKRNLNPLLSMFSGVHDVKVTAAATASSGQGHVNIQTVSIDDIEVPHMALQLFVNKYLKPKYPDLGLENTFQMPYRIDSATVGNDTALLTQR
jgi:hypothetical protein